MAGRDLRWRRKRETKCEALRNQKRRKEARKLRRAAKEVRYSSMYAAKPEAVEALLREAPKTIPYPRFEPGRWSQSTTTDPVEVGTRVHSVLEQHYRKPVELTPDQQRFLTQIREYRKKWKEQGEFLNQLGFGRPDATVAVQGQVALVDHKTVEAPDPHLEVAQMVFGKDKVTKRDCESRRARRIRYTKKCNRDAVSHWLR